MKTEIMLATNNEGKLQEFRDILSPLGYLVYSPKDLNLDFDPIENGRNFRENALIKANAASKITDFPVIADDSGLCIHDLNGFPGLTTARYLKEMGSLDGVLRDIGSRLPPDSKREATFECTICLIEHKGDKPLFFEGHCPGILLKEKRGGHGFGYDPIFHSLEHDLDFGTASEEEKNKVSHRGKALAKLALYLAI